MGRAIDLAQITPHSLKRFIHRDVAVSYWTRSMLNESINDNTGLWLEPIRAAVLNKDREEGAMTRSADIGTQWTQDRVAAVGYTSSK